MQLSLRNSRLSESQRSYKLKNCDAYIHKLYANAQCPSFLHQTPEIITFIIAATAVMRVGNYSFQRPSCQPPVFAQSLPRTSTNTFKLYL